MNDNHPLEFAALGIAEGESVVISRAQHETLMLAAKALKAVKHWHDFADEGLPHHVEIVVDDALAAVRAAGIDMGEK
jgi:hypothetical protein